MCIESNLSFNSSNPVFIRIKARGDELRIRTRLPYQVEVLFFTPITSTPAKLCGRHQDAVQIQFDEVVMVPHGTFPKW